MSKTFSQGDVAAHKKPDDLWVIVDEDVYDLTKFQTEHPGKYRAPLQGPRLTEDQVVKRVSIACLITKFSPINRRFSPTASSRKGCLETILEIPQRKYTEEVQRPAAGRLARQ